MAIPPMQLRDNLTFNPEMLRLARDINQKTKKAVADDIKLTPGFITQIEDGSKQPSTETVEKLREALKLPIGFFYQKGRYEGVPTSFYRRRKSIPKTVMKKCTARLALTNMTLKKILDEIDAPDCILPKMDPQETEGGPVGIARLVRIVLRIAAGPIRSLVDIFEEAGVIVIPFDFGTRQIDGCSDWIDGRPVIFYNSASARSRLRHTLSHELGHLVMHRIVDAEECEKEADTFAGEFNMPAKEIKSQLLALDIKKLASLKAHWKSAMSAILYRAKALGVISDYKYTGLLIQMRELNYHVDEPNEDIIPIERPQSLGHLLEAYFESLEFDHAQMLDHVLLSEEFFDDLLPRGRMLKAV